MFCKPECNNIVLFILFLLGINFFKLIISIIFISYACFTKFVNFNKKGNFDSKFYRPVARINIFKIWAKSKTNFFYHLKYIYRASIKYSPHILQLYRVLVCFRWWLRRSCGSLYDFGQSLHLYLWTVSVCRAMWSLTALYVQVIWSQRVHLCRIA